jgi:ADP-ribosylglycohydrolase
MNTASRYRRAMMGLAVGDALGTSLSLALVG